MGKILALFLMSTLIVPANVTGQELTPNQKAISENYGIDPVKKYAGYLTIQAIEVVEQEAQAMLAEARDKAFLEGWKSGYIQGQKDVDTSGPFWVGVGIAAAGLIGGVIYGLAK
jgi:hypothetical protein